ncbi:MFS transporter [Sneathiella sp.]|jgi:predicted MFS family arabinose efflux permease|uniref:MFS transporter n=1 Tax=Sneathiella sp. TaxID=1964365 RepID=UPI0039E408FB
MFLTSSTLPFLIREWRFLLFGLLLTFWSGPGQTFVISLFGKQIRQDFLLSHSEYGALYTAGTLLSALCLWKAGPLVDRIPLRQIAFKMAVLMVVVTALFPFAFEPISLLLGIFALRFCGQGMLNHISLTAMARRYENERGRALAIAGLGFPLAEALLPPLIVYGLAFTQWQTLWYLLAACMALTLLPLIPYLIVRTPDQDGGGASAADGQIKDQQTSWTRAQILKDGRFYLIAITPMMQSAAITAFFFHQVYLIEEKNWSFGWWSLCFTFFAGFSLLGGVFSGILVDLFRARRLVPFILLPLALGIYLFGQSEQSFMAAVIMSTLGFGAGMTNPVMSSLLPELYGTRHLGAIRAAATVVMVFGSALGPILLGWALDADFDIINISNSIAVAGLIGGLLCYIAVKQDQP